tara:strand:- start:425 stop:919 length:495 start_codon:yes stop_codon:yes gene_type:complete
VKKSEPCADTPPGLPSRNSGLDKENTVTSVEFCSNCSASGTRTKLNFEKSQNLAMLEEKLVQVEINKNAEIEALQSTIEAMSAEFGLRMSTLVAAHEKEVAEMEVELSAERESSQQLEATNSELQQNISLLTKENSQLNEKIVAMNHSAQQLASQFADMQSKKV